MCSVLYCRIAMAIETASKVGTFCIVVSLIVALAVPMMIQSKELPDGSVQLLLVYLWTCCIGLCHMNRFNAFA